jgi:hypothetical protein
MIWRLTGIGQGAAAWIAQRSEDTSWRARTSGGSFRIRTNIVGTTCVWVTRWCPISRRKVSASKCSMMTHVPPHRSTPMLKRSGAAWYSGAGDR